MPLTGIWTYLRRFHLRTIFIEKDALKKLIDT